MPGSFITRNTLEQETVDWGTLAWMSNPPSTGATQLTVLEVVLSPGSGHDFHKHPDQEEVIYILEGEVEQWLENNSSKLGPGDAVYIPADLVHASFNIGNTPAKFLVTLGPCVGDTGYELVDVANESPWKELR